MCAMKRGGDWSGVTVPVYPADRDGLFLGDGGRLEEPITLFTPCNSSYYDQARTQMRVPEHATFCFRCSAYGNVRPVIELEHQPEGSALTADWQPVLGDSWLDLTINQYINVKDGGASEATFIFRNVPSYRRGHYRCKATVSKGYDRRTNFHQFRLYIDD